MLSPPPSTSRCSRPGHLQRYLADIDLRLHPGTVIVGENRAGKSNLLHALRLILDPSFSYSDHQLRREDFWDGLSDGSSRSCSSRSQRFE